MERKDLIIGVYDSDGERGGERFGSVYFYSEGLKKGFEKCDVKTYSLKQCNDENIMPHLTIGFQNSGLEHWQTILNSGRPNIMWTLDSAFMKNTEYIEQFSAYDNFVVFDSTPCDNEPIAKFFPKLKHAYIPVGVDTDIWSKTGVEKDIDLLFMGAVEDPEEKLNHLKETMPELVYGLMLQIYELSLAHPALSFWQIVDIMKNHINLELDLNQYLLLFRNVGSIIAHKKRIDMIKTLKGFNVKVFGNELWKKFLPESAEYMGECDIRDSVDVVNRSKIVLSYNPFQLTLGLSDRLFNSSAAGTFVLSNYIKSIELAFGENIGSFNGTDFSDLPEKVDYYLKNEDERNAKSESARKTVLEKHTWKDRAEAILKIIEVE